MTREELAQYIKSELANDDTEIYLDIDDYKIVVKALEQEPILDKIRAEIESLEYLNIEDGSDGYDKYIEQYEVLKIIDKYRAESEE